MQELGNCADRKVCEFCVISCRFHVKVNLGFGGFHNMLMPGHATSEGTDRFRRRFEAKFPGHFREFQGLWLSSIGIGTYLGEPTAAYDALYREAVADALESGINVIDTAVNYRHQRSERAIAQALAAAISGGKVQRDEVLIATKGGFLTFDGSEPDDPSDYFQRTLIDTGLLRPDEVAAGCHVMSPKYLENQIDVSRHNLGIDTLDIYYLHNPETQSSNVTREEFDRRMHAAFSALEKAVGRGQDSNIRHGHLECLPRGAGFARGAFAAGPLARGGGSGRQGLIIFAPSNCPITSPCRKPCPPGRSAKTARTCRSCMWRAPTACWSSPAPACFSRS